MGVDGAPSPVHRIDLPQLISGFYCRKYRCGNRPNHVCNQKQGIGTAGERAPCLLKACISLCDQVRVEDMSAEMQTLALVA